MGQLVNGPAWSPDHEHGHTVAHRDGWTDYPLRQERRQDGRPLRLFGQTEPATGPLTPTAPGATKAASSTAPETGKPRTGKLGIKDSVKLSQGNDSHYRRPSHRNHWDLRSIYCTDEVPGFLLSAFSLSHHTRIQTHKLASVCIALLNKTKASKSVTSWRFPQCRNTGNIQLYRDHPLP